MVTILKIIVTVIVMVTIVIFYTLHRNGGHISQPPGAAKRLAVFFTVNSAATSDTPSFGELKTPVFAMDSVGLYQRVLSAGNELGWGIYDNDSDEHTVHFIVRSPLFLFEDDVYVDVNVINEKKASLNIQSSSRTGRADLAANSGHIQKLVKQLRAKK